MMVEVLADINWFPIMLVISNLAVIGFHCHLLQAYTMQWAAGYLKYDEKGQVEPCLIHEPFFAVTRIQRKIPALQDRSHEDDDEETHSPRC
ncbi:hypothetical protein HNR44_001497 [Geomicrobium halophilum]|uniref:Uncharacterized protein n=1 Tax=Geomicrobium halophilum TaxID=549000 RepID=A0A841Q195_9BACL|nr:hypothetical protein [Geomicrobium halophilum]MBB6449548.1 hypothetical protein [Geomicrobium halophilum]